MSHKYKNYPLEDFRVELCNIIFARDDYSGFYSPDWLRRLLSFYITILKINKKEYPDPFKYLEYTSELDLLQYHFYLLNIDNRSIHNLSVKSEEISEKKKLVRTAVNNFVSVHQLKTPSDVENKINHIKTEVEEIREKIKAYKLASSQKLNADKANEISKEINKLSFENFSNQNKIDTYKASLSNNLSIRLSTVENIYNEYQKLLGSKIRKELQDAVKFRKNLVFRGNNL